MNERHALAPLKAKVIGAAAAVFVLGVAGGLLATDRLASLRFTLAISFMAALYSLVAIPLFLTGLKNFKSGLNRSYVLLCVGIGLFGIAQVQIPLITYFGWYDWLNSGGAVLVYFISVIPMLLGVRKFAKLLQIKSRWSSLLLCALAAIVASGVAALLPHVKSNFSDTEFHIFIGIALWNILVTTFCGMLCLKIHDRIAPTYKKSLQWLAAAFFVLATAGLHLVVVYFFFTDGDWYFDYSLSILPFVIGGLMFVKAGYEFDTIDYTLSEADTTETDRPQPTALDIITHVASLASSPSDIDAILDDMRVVTSRIEQGQAPAATDDDKLGEVYQRLVVYLTRQDPLRQYTKESIQANLTSTFGEHVAFLEKQRTK